MIEIINKTRSKIDLKLVNRVVSKFFEVYKIKKEISIVFIGDTLMRRLNCEYRGKDKVTDILSFSLIEIDDFGEIVIDYLQIKRQSKLYSKSIREELIFILVHGLFHLLGYDDDVEERRLKMIEMGRKFIEKYKMF